MPSIKEVKAKKGSFSKKSYRTWNLSGESTQEGGAIPKNNKDLQKNISQEVCIPSQKKPDNESSTTEIDKNAVTNYEETASTKNQAAEQKADQTATKDHTSSEYIANSAQLPRKPFATSTKPVSNPLATHDQPVSNPLATHDQPVSNPLATHDQLISNSLATQITPVSDLLATHDQPISNPLATHDQPVSRPISRPVSSGASIIKNSSNGFLTIPPEGKERELLNYILELVISSCSLETPPITTRELVESLSINTNRLRNTINRAKNKGLLSITSSHCGSTNPYRVFRITEEVYNHLIKERKAERYTNSLADPLADPLASDNVVSSSSIINNTITNLPEGYENIDFSELEKYGFKLSHLLQISKEYVKNPENRLSNEIIQDSINALFFDLEHNEVALDFKKDPIVVLVSLLKKGQPYSSKTPGSYMSPKEQAMKRYLEDKERKRKETESMLAKVRELEFQDWEEKLSPKIREELLGDSIPKNIPPKVRERTERAGLKNYFDENVWPDLRKEINF